MSVWRQYKEQQDAAELAQLVQQQLIQGGVAGSSVLQQLSGGGVGLQSGGLGLQQQLQQQLQQLQQQQVQLQQRQALAAHLQHSLASHARQPLRSGLQSLGGGYGRREGRESKRQRHGGDGDREPRRQRQRSPAGRQQLPQPAPPALAHRVPVAGALPFRFDSPSLTPLELATRCPQLSIPPCVAKLVNAWTSNGLSSELSSMLRVSVEPSSTCDAPLPEGQRLALDLWPAENSKASAVSVRVCVVWADDRDAIRHAPLLSRMRLLVVERPGGRKGLIGGVADGEDLEKEAARHLREQTGIDAPAGTQWSTLLEVHRNYTRAGEPTSERIVVLIAKLPAGAEPLRPARIVQPSEGQEEPVVLQQCTSTSVVDALSPQSDPLVALTALSLQDLCAHRAAAALYHCLRSRMGRQRQPEPPHPATDVPDDDLGKPWYSGRAALESPPAARRCSSFEVVTTVRCRVDNELLSLLRCYDVAQREPSGRCGVVLASALRDSLLQAVECTPAEATALVSTLRCDEWGQINYLPLCVEEVQSTSVVPGDALSSESEIASL